MTKGYFLDDWAPSTQSNLVTTELSRESYHRWLQRLIAEVAREEQRATTQT